MGFVVIKKKAEMKGIFSWRYIGSFVGLALSGTSVLMRHPVAVQPGNGHSRNPSGE